MIQKIQVLASLTTILIVKMMKYKYLENMIQKYKLKIMWKLYNNIYNAQKYKAPTQQTNKTSKSGCKTIKLNKNNPK